MPIKLNERHLRRLCQINSFSVPNDGIVFFGLRGCQSVNEDNNEFQPEQILIMGEIDSVHPRWALELAEKLVKLPPPEAVACLYLSWKVPWFSCSKAN